MASKTPPRPDRSPPGDGLAVSRPGAATMSPARNTPSPRSTLGRSGEDPGAVPPWPNRVLIQPAPPRGDRHPVDQAGGVDLVTEFRQAPAAKRHAPGGRQLAGDRLVSMTTAEGKRRDPARPLAIPQPRTALLAEPLAPLRHRVDRHPKPARELDVLLCLGGEHDPGPEDVALLRGRPAQPALQHPPLGGR